MNLCFLSSHWVFFAHIVSSQSISQLLSSHLELSSLAGIINSIPPFVDQLAGADHFTFLAPTNDALSAWLTGNHSQDDIKATLEYHLLNGIYTTALLSSTPQFAPTCLTNNIYSNVTGGQRVKILKRDGEVSFKSGLNTTSDIVSADEVATGGIVHTIHTVLELPIDKVTTASLLNLSYFIAIGQKVNFLSIDNRLILDEFAERSDLTWFIPNSVYALEHFNTTGLDHEDVTNLLQYHCIEKVVYSTDFKNGTQLNTCAGIPVMVTVLEDGEVYINNARLTGRDVLLSNGVGHIIDSVLDPSNPSGPASVASPSSKNPNSLANGAIAGIVVGGVVAIGLSFWIGFLFRRRTRANRGNRIGEESGGNTDVPSRVDYTHIPELPPVDHIELPGSQYCYPEME